MENNIALGRWAVFPILPALHRDAVGGPYRYGEIVRVGADIITVQMTDGKRRVHRKTIAAAYPLRTTALATVKALDALLLDYIQVRANLIPKFEARARAILNNTTPEGE